MRKVLPEGDVKRLLEAGKGPTETARWLHDHRGLDVTPEAISNLRRRRPEWGLATSQPRWADLLPWTVRAEHLQRQVAKNLRNEARQRAGLRLTPRAEKLLAEWKRRLEEMAEREGWDRAVVHYDPETPKGWFYVEARPKDHDLIRIPD